jgi:hypothetical protein
MIVEKACWERGCACYDHRVDEGVKVTLAREWQGLTDEEIDAAVKSCNTVDTYKYFRAIEAKLKEKNT